MPSFKLLDNIAYQVKFLYDKPKVWDNTDDQGKAYKTYSYGVEINQKNEYLGVSEAVHNMLQSFGPLSARTLEIAKVQDPGDLKKKHWVFKENGVELRPSGISTPVPSQSPVERKNEANNDGIAALNARLDKASDAFKALNEKFTSLEDKFKSLENLVSEISNKQAVDLHTSLKNRDIRETKEIVKDAAAIVNSYKSDPTIPTINGVPEGFDK